MVTMSLIVLPSRVSPRTSVRFLSRSDFSSVRSRETARSGLINNSASYKAHTSVRIKIGSKSTHRQPFHTTSWTNCPISGLVSAPHTGFPTLSLRGVYTLSHSQARFYSRDASEPPLGKSAQGSDTARKHTAPEMSEHSHSHGPESADSRSHETTSHSDSSPSEHSYEHSHDHSHEHSHDHSHGLLHSHTHGPNELLGKGFTTNPAVRITWIGLIVNVAMAGAKATGGVYFHSQALMADAIHSLSDMVADFLTLATVNVALKEGTFTKFPLGYGKIESVGTLLVSGVLLFAGFTVGWLSLLQIFEYVLPTQWYDYALMLQVHSHSHAFDVGTAHSHSHLESPGTHLDVHVKEAPNINAAWLALASIGVKELLYKKTMKVAAESNSKVLIANAWHHRIDSLTAAVAFLTVTSGYLFGVVWLDAVGGVLVSLLIVNAGFSTLRDSWYELIDRSAPPKSETYNTIKLLVEEEVDNVAALTKTDCQLVDVSVLCAGARSNVMVKLGTSEDLLLLKLQKLEFELVSSLRAKDKYLGRVFVEYELKKNSEGK